MPKGGDPEGGFGPSEEEITDKNDSPGDPGLDVVDINLQMLSSFLNPDPYTQWYIVENVARATIGGQQCWVLLDNGCQVNSITLQFIETSRIPMGLLLYLMPSGK